MIFPHCANKIVVLSWGRACETNDKTIIKSSMSSVNSDNNITYNIKLITVRNEKVFLSVASGLQFEKSFRKSKSKNRERNCRA